MHKLLKEIAEVKAGYSLRKSIKPDINGNAYIVTPKNVSINGSIYLNEAIKITISNPEKHFIQDKEVLITARGRFTATTFNLIKENNFVASSGFHRINVIDENFLPEYIALFLNSKEGQKALKSIQETMTIPSIIIGELQDIKIPSIALNKQKQLIELSSSFYEWKTLRQKQEDLQSTIINQTISKIIGE